MANVQKSTDSSSLAEVVDRILDKGIVIDVWAKVSLVGIELLSIEARVVIASVETYLKYAEAIGLTMVEIDAIPTLHTFRAISQPELPVAVAYRDPKMPVAYHTPLLPRFMS